MAVRKEPVSRALRDNMLAATNTETITNAEIIYIVIAALGVLVALITFFALYKRKRLSYEIITNVPFMNEKDKLAGKLDILYENTPVENVQLVEIRIINTGNEPIKDSDYASPLAIVFNEARILTTEIVRGEPDNVEAKIWEHEDNVQIRFPLMNRKDAITFRFLVSDFKNQIDISGRIAGVKEIKKYKQKDINRRIFLLSMAALTIGLLTYNIFCKENPEPTVSHNEPFLFQLFIYSSMGVFLFSFLWQIISPSIPSIRKKINKD